MTSRRVPLETRFHTKYARGPEDACWLWLGGCSTVGYGVIHDSRGGEGPRRQRLAHRVAYELHRGPIPAGMFVCHKCDVPRCVNPAHLFLGTQSDNITDCATKGRLIGNRKLTPDRVLAIRALRDAGWSGQKIARHFGIPAPTVYEVVRNHSWAHL